MHSFLAMVDIMKIFVLAMAIIIFFYCWYQKQKTYNVRGSVMAKHKELYFLFGEKLSFFYMKCHGTLSLKRPYKDGQLCWGLLNFSINHQKSTLYLMSSYAVFMNLITNNVLMAHPHCCWGNNNIAQLAMIIYNHSYTHIVLQILHL